MTARGSNKEKISTSIIGMAQKVVVSPGHGFHDIPIEWHKIGTPSQQKGKKSREEDDGLMEVLAVNSQA